jgi:transposase
MPKKQFKDEKSKILEENKTLNKHDSKVKAPLFESNPFFDPKDIVQVKYEMLRSVEKDGQPVSETASVFGFSRVSFYKIQDEFKNNGVLGLIPKKRGPQGASKLNKEVMEFIDEHMKQNPKITKKQLVETLEATAGIRVHKRSIERALSGGKKKQDKHL